MQKDKKAIRQKDKKTKKNEKRHKSVEIERKNLFFE